MSSAKWNKENREKIAAWGQAYRSKNREKIAASKAAYRANNREKIAAYNADRYAAKKQLNLLKGLNELVTRKNQHRL